MPAHREKEAHNRAVVLEMIGDLPEADAKPPANMLFICKLNPVTTEEDLDIIFSRFGTITSCDIIRWGRACRASPVGEARETDKGATTKKRIIA